MSEYEQPHPVVPGADEVLASNPAPAPWTYTGGHVLPAEPAPAPSRRVGRTALVATLTVLLVLVGGGAAYGWSFLHRPDVQVARAFEATKAAPSGDMTMSLTAGSSGEAALLTGSSVRYAWGPGTQQVTVTLNGKQVATVVTTDTHLTLAADLAATPLGAEATDQLGRMAAGLGPDGQVLIDLAAGKPVGVDIGPGSALRAALDKTAKASGSSAGANATPDQIASVADAIAQAVKDDVTVTAAGSDQYGEHYLASLPMAKVAAAAATHLATLAPGLAAGATPDLSSLDGVTLTADVWVRDGVLSRIQVPLAAALGKAGVSPGGDATLLVVLGSAGVQAPAGPVSDVPDSLIRSLTGSS